MNDAPLSNTSSDYIFVDPVWHVDSGNQYRNRFTYTKSLQYRMATMQTRNDIRVSYSNPDFPYIISAHRMKIVYQNSSVFAGQADMATFEIPLGTTPGNYIYWFYWGGYKDCVDVNVQASVVAQPFGNRNATTAVGFTKINHCEFTNIITVPSSRTMCRAVVANSAQECLTKCSQDGSCTAVQAVRLQNPSHTLPYTPNIPWTRYNSALYDNSLKTVLGPCGHFTVNNREKNGCDLINTNCNNASLKLLPPDTYICFGVSVTRDQDIQAAEDYQISLDPSDPIFYSTCWFKIANTGFTNYPIPPVEPLPWAYGEKCVTCEFQALTNTAALDYVPDWDKGLADVCKNCDTSTF